MDACNFLRTQMESLFVDSEDFFLLSKKLLFQKVSTFFLKSRLLNLIGLDFLTKIETFGFNKKCHLKNSPLKVKSTP